ncbi:carboxypeptidase regulatory-like domain-containing protein [Hyphobacterium sp.]|uniref:TonB-dependent receptor n=1 Tax=Hyphobacterium sp. TaxID=2004662 RepID=UPI0037482CB2
MSFSRKLSYSAAAAALFALAAPAAVYAQNTSSQVRGSVVAEDGSAINGATVTIIHIPSGTVSTTVTSGNGNFFQSGLRVGGPYRIAVQAEGYQADIIEDLNLVPGSNTPLRVSLQGGQADTIVVLGQRIESLDINNGVGSTFSARDIANQPSANRDVIGTLLRDPLATSQGEGNLSVAGINPRFNALAIDGALQQDNFGLGSNTYATSRSPINLDAIASASIVASDYSVTAGNFTGGLVNVVTRSGSNEFDGSLFYYRADEDFRGNVSDGVLIPQPAFTEEEYGITLGGPIIEDQLFFFVSYDEFESGSGQNFSSSDAQNGINPGFFAALNTLFQNTYGVDLGGRPLTTATPVTSERFLGRIDWNINEDHRAAFTYQSTKETGTSTSSTGFVSSWYDTPTEVTAYTGQLFSDWNQNFSTTFRINYTEFLRGQNCRAGSNQPHFEFRLDDTDVAGTALDGLLTSSNTIVGGCDRFRHANEYDDTRLTVFGSGDYIWGDHVFTFGGEYEDFELRNLFISSANGRFIFNDVNDIINGNARIEYQNVPSNDKSSGASQWSVSRYTVFAQDTVQVLPELEISGGFRWEFFGQDDLPPNDPAAQTNYGQSSQENLDGLDLFMPRFSARWTPLDRTTVSGGFGLYSGGNPLVWISNAFQQSTGFASANNVNVSGSFDIPQNLLTSVANGTPSVIDAIDPNFEIPSDWRASVRLDQEFDAELGDMFGLPEFFNLGTDYRFTFQYLYNRTNQGFMWENLAQTQLAATQPTGVSPDGRPIYANLQSLGIRNFTQLTNHDEGENHIFTVTLAKEFENGLGFQWSYAYQDVQIGSEGSSSRGISNWRSLIATDRNNPSARTSPYQVEDRFALSFWYEREFFGDLTTRFDLFGEIQSGDPFTYTFDYDFGRDNHLFGRAGDGEAPYDNDPLYIPTMNDARVVYASSFDAADQAAFNAFIDREGLTRGQIAPVNGSFSSWNQTWDLRIQQELGSLPFVEEFVGDNRFNLVVDIENFLNMLNDEWGTQYNGPGFDAQALVRADLVSAADVAANGVDGATALTGDQPRTVCVVASDCVYRYNRYNDFRENGSSLSTGRSVYNIRVGLRYEF